MFYYNNCFMLPYSALDKDVQITLNKDGVDSSVELDSGLIDSIKSLYDDSPYGEVSLYPLLLKGLLKDDGALVLYDLRYLNSKNLIYNSRLNQLARFIRNNNNPKLRMANVMPVLSNKTFEEFTDDDIHSYIEEHYPNTCTNFALIKNEVGPVEIA